ncbi:membrane protein [Rhizocola hellebori]|uniref:Membrane protein n=1 Tax=Rhizocola hellebori TaxID=1392758 RepID=A0A8J3VKD8_9ACTN|nr:TlpA disulfide reductase family protein [Rhizocola hellebori]GIH08981.1 membrane protein [Rhizocola hellebori]
MRRAVLALVLLVAGCTSTAPPTPMPTPPPFRDCASIFEGKAELPELALPCFTGGQNVQVGRLSGPAVINFWAPWCLECGEELPAFQRLADRGQVKVIGVATDTNRSAAISLATDLGVTMPTLLDVYGEFRRQLGTINLPLTVFVDSNGKVTTYVGSALKDETLNKLVRERLGVG